MKNFRNISILLSIVLWVLIIYRLYPSEDTSPETSSSNEVTLSKNNTATSEETSSSPELGESIEVVTIGKDEEKSLKVQEYISLLNSSDVCAAVSRLKDDKDITSQSYALRVYFKNKESTLNELSNSLAYAFFDFEKRPSSERELFFYVYNYPNNNKKRKLSIFRKLQKLNPDNGAYYFFNLVNLSSKKEIINEIELLSQAKYFDTHFSWITKGIRENTFDSVSAFYMGLNVFSQVRLPSFKEPKKILLDHIEKGVDKDKLLSYSKKIVKTNTRSNGKYIDLLWQPIEHAIFRNIAIKLDPSLSKKMKRTMDLMKEGNNDNSRDKRAEFLSDLHSNCDDKSAENFLQFEQNTYHEFRSKYNL
jgi:hypothetical protein